MIDVLRVWNREEIRGWKSGVKNALKFCSRRGNVLSYDWGKEEGEMLAHVSCRLVNTELRRDQ